MGGIKKSKYIISLLAILIISVILTACENITSEDINLDDLGNILSVIRRSDDDLVPSPQQPIPAETSEDIYTDFSQDDLNSGEVNETETAADIAYVQEVTETAVLELTNTTESTAVAPDRISPVILRNFPDMPDAFKYVPFPDTLVINDAMKRSVKNLDSLLKRDFGGNIFYAATTNPEMLTPFLGGGVLNDARYYRTRLVESAYNIKIQSIYMNRENIYQTITNGMRAGDYISDIICVPLDIQSLFIQDGFLINLRKIPFINLNADYYNKSSVNANTINGEIYGVVSDLFFDPSKIYAVFYNKNLLKECGLENLDDLYENDKWTYDEMLAICKTLTTNIDTAANDLFSIGLSSENNDVSNGMYIPSNRPPNGAEPAGVYEKIEDVIARIINNRDGISPLISGSNNTQRNVFSRGSMLFGIMTLDIIYDITDSSFDWGVLPIPAININENYLYPSFAFTQGSALCLSVLNGVRNSEQIGIISEALAIASHDYMQDMYVSDLMTYNLRDMTSVNVIDSILRNVMYRNMRR